MHTINTRLLMRFLEEIYNIYLKIRNLLGYLSTTCKSFFHRCILILPTDFVQFQCANKSSL